MHPVVHAVVRGCVQDPLERTEGVDDFGVDPKLVEAVEPVGRQVGHRVDAEEGERGVKQKPGQWFKRGLAQGDREVEVIRLVMNTVDRPKAVPDMVIKE